MKIGQESVEAPVHDFSTISKGKQGCRPRAILTPDLITKINPPIVDASVGEVVPITFKNGRTNTAFFATSQSKCPLLKQLYECFQAYRKELELMCKQIPAHLWITDTLAGGKYLPMGVSVRSGTQGSSKKLPFLRKECSNRLLMDISKIYAKLLGIEASIIQKYCPTAYNENKEKYQNGEDCIFPSPQDQHKGQLGSQLFHYCQNQVALRIINNELDKADEQLHRVALHTDTGDVNTDQPLTFLSFGGKDDRGGEVSGSDLVIFEHSNGGQCYRLKTSIESAVVFVLFNSAEQLHGNIVDNGQTQDPSCWSVRFIGYGRINVLNFMMRRKEKKIRGKCFCNVKLQKHTALRDGEFKPGDKISSFWKKKLLSGKICCFDDQFYIQWCVDGKFTKLGNGQVYSFECSESAPHDCKRCNPTGEEIVSRFMGQS